MDHTMERVSSAGLISCSIRTINEAAHRAREAQCFEIATQLDNLVDELVYLHRQVLELPPQKTSAACEFERSGQFEDDEVPF